MTDHGLCVSSHNLDQTLLALCDDTTANVVICDRTGAILHANHVARCWIDWREAEHAAPQGSDLFCDTTTTAELLRERRKLCERVCDQERAVVYESICRNIRYRVTMRPVKTKDDRVGALIVSRRMQPWERIEAGEGGPEPVTMQHHDPGVFASLSARELEVLVLIAEGLSYAEIAERLHRSVRTIERHRDRLGQKLGAHNRVQLARYAFRAGLTEMPTPPEAARLEAEGYDPLGPDGLVRRLASLRLRPGARS